MKLPHAESAIIEDSKISCYLLSVTHAEGRGKALFFVSFGFDPKAPEVLRRALLALARNAGVFKVVSSPHGTKYTVEGAIQAPDGRCPVVRAIWVIETGTNTPRLVTALPGKRSKP